MEHERVDPANVVLHIPEADRVVELWAIRQQDGEPVLGMSTWTIEGYKKARPNGPIAVH